MWYNLKMPGKVSPKDVFLHLLAIVTLYTSAVSFLVLVFQYVNVLFPDPLGPEGFYYFSAYYGRIRWSISSLIVVFPVYLWASWFLNKDYKKNPQKRDLRIRKWLVYFTLFAAALIIVGDLVTLINFFLQGELTSRFILKVLAVLFVAGSVFGYYLQDIKNTKNKITCHSCPISRYGVNSSRNPDWIPNQVWNDRNNTI